MGINFIRFSKAVAFSFALPKSTHPIKSLLYLSHTNSSWIFASSNERITHFFLVQSYQHPYKAPSCFMVLKPFLKPPVGLM